MTDKKQDPHAELMDLADWHAEDRVRAGQSPKTYISREALSDFARTLTDRIAELEAQLEAVGAGGVGVMMPAKKEPTVPDNMQDWAGMDGAIAWHLIERHADNWADIGKMMGEWLAANRGAQPAPAVVEPFGYFKAEPFGWTDCAETDEGAIALYASPPPHQIAEPASHAVKDVLAERQRQINVEGWTPELDDDRVDGQMAGAASCYAKHVNARSWVATDLDNGPEIYRTEPTPDNWPWDESWWKPTTPRRDAVKACALLLAEIERIDRATNHKEQS